MLDLLKRYKKKLNKSKPTTQSGRILQLLKAHPLTGVSNYELARVSLRAGARIYDLRKSGHNIQSVQISRGTWKYYLNDDIQ